jgi:hypothetical protein
MFPKNLEEVFRHKVFKLLLSQEKITEDLVNMLMNWPPARKENLARYIIRASLPARACLYRQKYLG